MVAQFTMNSTSFIADMATLTVMTISKVSFYELMWMYILLSGILCNLLSFVTKKFQVILRVYIWFWIHYI